MSLKYFVMIIEIRNRYMKIGQSLLVEEPGYGIWVGTVAGLSFFNPKDNSFTDYSSGNNDLSSLVSSFLYSDRSVVWIGSDHGLFFVDKDDRQIHPFISSKGKEIEEEVRSITESPKYIYAATSNCIYQIDKYNNELVNLCDIEVLKPLGEKGLPRY